MIYDLRMGPQALYHDGEFIIAYQADPAHQFGHPHLIKRNKQGEWSDPVQVGHVNAYDHHYAPIIWTDAQMHVHVLYHCHIINGQAIHLVSDQPWSINGFHQVPLFDASINYPRILKTIQGRLILYYRALGHMGYWTYKISDDGGFTWNGPDYGHIDFDYLPILPGDDWAGSYHSVELSRDGKSLHIGFVDWDERNPIHSKYGKISWHLNRFKLYYARLSIESGSLFNADGHELSLPLNRHHAKQCLIWDTKSDLTNVPSMHINTADEPSFLLPKSDSAPDDCAFWYLRRVSVKWLPTKLGDCSSIWNGMLLNQSGDTLCAWLIGAQENRKDHFYGGGPLQEWHSLDVGESWKLNQTHGDPSLLLNNPAPVYRLNGTVLPNTVLCFGWPANQVLGSTQPFSAQAFLWHQGSWL